MPTPGTDRLTPAWERIHFGDVDFWWQKSFEGSSSCKWSDPFDYQRHIVRLVDHLTRDFWGMVKSWSCKSLFFPTQYTFIPHIQVLFNVNNTVLYTSCNIRDIPSVFSAKGINNLSSIRSSGAFLKYELNYQNIALSLCICNIQTNTVVNVIFMLCRFHCKCIITDIPLNSMFV